MAKSSAVSPGVTLSDRTVTAMEPAVEALIARTTGVKITFITDKFRILNVVVVTNMASERKPNITIIETIRNGLANDLKVSMTIPVGMIIEYAEIS